MANKIAKIGLAPGKIAFYCDSNDIFLTKKNKTQVIYDTDNLSKIREAIANHEIVLIEGTLQRELIKTPHALLNKTNLIAPPMIFGVEDVIININQFFNKMLGVKAMDNEQRDITNEVRVEGLVDVNTPGEYHLVYTVADKAGNVATAKRCITVVDNIAPVFSGVEDKQINPGESFNAMDGVSAHDNVDGDVTRNIRVEREDAEEKQEANIENPAQPAQN